MRNSEYLYHRSKIDYFFIVIIILSPFAFYLHLLAPDDMKVWDTFMFTIDAGYFEFVEYYLWIYSYKLLILILLIIWFLTCKHWWKFILCVPISFEIYKLVSFINDRYSLFEDYSIVDGLPFIMITILILLGIKKRLSYVPYDNNGMLNINFEIYELLKEISSKQKMNVKELKEEYKLLKEQKGRLEMREYLLKLIELNDKFTKVN